MKYLNGTTAQAFGLVQQTALAAQLTCKLLTTTQAHPQQFYWLTAKTYASKLQTPAPTPTSCLIYSATQAVAPTVVLQSKTMEPMCSQFCLLPAVSQLATTPLTPR